MKASPIPHLHPKKEDGASTGGEAPFTGIPDEEILIRVNGRIFKLTKRAIKSYAEEYGFGEDVPFILSDCLDHISNEFEEALKSDSKPIGLRGRMVRMTSPSLIFKLVGSKIVSIRISLKYNPRQEASVMPMA
tara:strand:- start:546 stop:944 length:399 start_codon:yes stop_codon:yes gene_type:complete